MKKLIIIIALALPALGQNLATVSGSNTQDLNGAKLSTGQICFLGTDQNDTPISFQVGGGGQALRRGYCSTITAGVITTFTIPNPANTLPSGIYYRITVKDTSTGQEVLRYRLVSFTGGTFNFDTYTPFNLAAPAPLSGTSVTGNLGVTGNISATGTVTGSNIPANILGQIFNAGTGLTQRTAFNVLAGITCSDNAGTSRTDCRLGTLTTVAFSATPTFDASTAAAFKLTLTGNVTSSTLSNAVAGEPLAFEICQDATGGRTFVPPANVQGWLPIKSTANACSLEVFYYDGTNAQPDLLAGLTGDVTSTAGSTATTVTVTHLASPLPTAQGGTNQNSTATFPAAGVVVTEAATETLTNKTLTSPVISTISNTGTLTLPTSTDTLTGRATTDTLTNKTLNGASSGNSVELLCYSPHAAALTGNSGDQTVFTCTIPANVVGVNKGFSVTAFMAHTAGTASVTYKASFGGTNLFSQASTSHPSPGGLMVKVECMNNASTSSQDCSAWYDDGDTAQVFFFATPSVNTTSSQNVVFTFNVANTDQVTPRMMMGKLLQ